MAPNQDTQIIGYAEPWIVSPGDPVDIKVGSQCSKVLRLFPTLEGYTGGQGCSPD